LTILILSVGLRAEAPYSGPKKLGPFVVEDRKFPIQRFFDSLGPPASARSNTFCYESNDGTTFLWFERLARSAGYPNAVGSVLVSDFRNCVGHATKTTRIDRNGWKTEKGVGLGSTTGGLFKAHGKPSAIENVSRSFRWVIAGDENSNAAKPELGQTVWIYRGAEDDLNEACFGIRSGKVAWIFLSHNE
jgi:hypothetical protein